MTAIPQQRGQEVAAEIISEPAAFTALREEWNELLQDSESDGYFLTWEWLHAWWNHLADGRRLFIIAVRSGPKLVAIAPFALRAGSLLRSPPLPCLEMLGCGTIGSDHLDLIIRKGWEAEAAQIIAKSLTDAGQTMVLARLRRDSTFTKALVAKLDASGWHGDETKLEVCPFLPRPPGGFTEYLAGLGSEHRYAFKRKVTALKKKFSVTFDAAKTEDERKANLAAVIDLHKKRWAGRPGESEAFDTPQNCAFHDEVTKTALEKGQLRLFVLRVDGQAVASLYGFRYGRIFSFYQSGFDPAWSKQSVGMVTMGLAIEAAFDEGADEFDMLHGDEPYKFHWAKEVHPLSRFELYPPGARGVVFQGVNVLAKSARRAGRKLLEKTASPDGARRAATP